MTEREAIRVIDIEKQCVLRNIDGCDRDCGKCDLVMLDKDIISGYNTAIKALEEIQEYRVIGTVEQLTDMKQNYAEALSDWRQYRKIGTVEECRSAMKNKMELPCAVGDDVWYISKRVERKGRKKMEVPFVDHGVVDNITLGHMMIPQITVCNDVNVWTTFDGVEDFCKIVFLSREEAEAALKELEGEWKK